MLIGCSFAFTACFGIGKVKVFHEIELTAESYAFAVQKGPSGKNILTTANEVIAEIKANGKLDEIINAFFDGTSTFSYTNTVKNAPTNDRGNYLIVATNAQFPLFEYTEGASFTGVDIEIASLIAQKLGKTLYVNDMEFDSVITTVSLGQADIAMAGLTVNEERMKTVDFSNEYYESAQVLMVREDDNTFDGCTTAEQVEAIFKQKDKSYKVGTQNGTTGYMYMAGDEDFGYDGFPNLTTSGYVNGALAAKDLQNRRIDAVVIDKQPAIFISKGVNAYV